MNRERDLLWLFDIGLILKCINGGIEILGGLLVILVPRTLIVKIVTAVTGGELASDPNDTIAMYLRTLAHSFAVHTHYFIALYLVLHGTIKIILVIGIFSGKRIAYPIFIVVLGIFGAYEAYRGIAYHEVLLQFLAVFDIALLALTSYEYRHRYPHHSSSGW